MTSVPAGTDRPVNQARLAQIEKLDAYAERSLAWEHGQKSEDELLQRIWNLAHDVRTLCTAAVLRESAASSLVAVTTDEGEA